jgi:type III pantothenate kinase
MLESARRSDGSGLGLGGSPKQTLVVAEPIASAIEDQLGGRGGEVYRVGEDLPVPIGQQLEPETITGIDRLLNAAAAFETLKQACIIVDAGTAVTVDFVDG